MIFADPRGSGRSSRPLDNRAMSSALMAKDINGLIQHLMLAPVNLIAHSNGGAIATALAANHPDSCNRLVLVDSQLVGFDASEGTGKFLACARDDPRYRDAVRYTELALPRTDEAFTRHLKNLLPLYFHDPLQMVLRFLKTMDGLVSANAFHAQAAADRMVAVNQTDALERIGADPCFSLADTTGYVRSRFRNACTLDWLRQRSKFSSLRGISRGSNSPNLSSE